MILLSLCSCKTNNQSQGKNEYSESCYSDVVNLIDKYKSDKLKNEVKDAYKYFGKTNYNSDDVEKSDKAFERKIINDISDLAEKYIDENDKSCLTFAYNYLLLLHLQYQSESMGIDKSDGLDYKEELDKYYTLLNQKASLTELEGFKKFITDNQIMTYRNLPQKTSEKDIATIIKPYCTLYITCIKESTNELEKRNFTSSFSAYSEAIEVFYNILDTLEGYPDLSDSFTKYDIEEMRKTAQLAKSANQTLCDNYTTNNAYAFLEYNDKMNLYYVDIKNNVDKGLSQILCKL